MLTKALEAVADGLLLVAAVGAATARAETGPVSSEVARLSGGDAAAVRPVGGHAADTGRPLAGAESEGGGPKAVRRHADRRYCTPGSSPVLTFIPGSSVKVEQVTGDCDWVQWDATDSGPNPTCVPTVSQTATRADVLGCPTGASFEDDGKLIFLFADTIGATTGNGDENPYYPTWAIAPNTYKWKAGDPIGWSTTTRAEDGLLVNFFMDGTHALPVQPSAQPDGTAVGMGPDEFPGAGINLDGQAYIVCMTGTVSSAANGGTGADYSNDRSVVVKFDETAQTFTSGRTISKVSNGGHFVFVGLHEAEPEALANPAHVFTEPMVVTFGVGRYWKSNIYLSVVPKSEFWSGVDSKGNSATLYFAGLDAHGNPTWSALESDAAPVVNDVEPSNPTIGNFSVARSPELGLWFITFSGGLNGRATDGAYFAYAPTPWGPWSTPQLIFNPCRDHGFGEFIRYYYATAGDDFCPSAMPPGSNPAPGGAGPAGPTIGPQTLNDPQTTRGGGSAPQMIERFIEADGDTLKVFYNISTWNPYAVVLMESDFSIACSGGS